MKSSGQGDINLSSFLDIFLDGLLTCEKNQRAKINLYQRCYFSKPVLAVDDIFRFVSRYLVDADTHQPRLNSFLKSRGIVQFSLTLGNDTVFGTGDS